jgi:predicted phosphodiesterase
VRILLISDIHANLEGLQACLAAAPPHDLVANLGDVVGYGASPNEVAAEVRNWASPIVRGNHDRACSGLMSLADFNAVAAQAAMWTHRTLTAENVGWLRELPAGPRELALSNGGAAPVLVHGSPLDEDEYVITLQEALEALRATPARLTFFGHTHLQGGFGLDSGAAGNGQAIRPEYGSRTQAGQYRLKLAPGTRYLINPGSAGQPRDSDWRAAFALFDSDADEVIFFRVPYDVAAAQQRIRNAGLPERLASRLAEGR